MKLKCIKCGNAHLKRTSREDFTLHIPSNKLFVCTDCYEIMDANQLGLTLQSNYPSYYSNIENGYENDDEEENDDKLWEEHSYWTDQFFGEIAVESIYELSETAPGTGFIYVSTALIEYFEMTAAEFIGHFTRMANTTLPREDGIKRTFIIEALSSYTYTIHEVRTDNIQSPIYWYGGKGNMKNAYVDLIDQVPHKHYISVFGGSACIELAKKPSSLETFNDLNSGVTNLFKVLKSPAATAKLRLSLNDTLYSYEEFQYCKEHWKKQQDDLEKARMFFVATNQAFNANGGWKTTRNETSQNMARTLCKWNAKQNALLHVHERFKNVQIDNRDFRKVINSYDTADSLFFLDPPYVPDTRSQTTSYLHEMSIEDHKELVQQLLNLKGKAILCGYDNPIYECLVENGWRKKSVGIFSKTSSNISGNAPMANELVWINFNDEGIKLDTTCNSFAAASKGLEQLSLL